MIGLLNIIGDTKLCIGDMWAANDFNIVKENNITHILNMTSMKLMIHPGIVHYNIELYDTVDQDILNVLDESFEFINNAIESNKRNGIKDFNILVHCQAGVSRSASIVIAYIMAHENKTYKDALEYVRKYRPIISPNKGFVNQLIEFEKTISIVI